MDTIDKLKFIWKYCQSRLVLSRILLSAGYFYYVFHRFYLFKCCLFNVKIKKITTDNKVKGLTLYRIQLDC